MKRVIFVVCLFFLILLFDYSLFSLDFWDFRSSFVNVFNSDLEKKFFEEYRKSNKIPDLEVWLIMASGIYDYDKIDKYKKFIDKISLDISNNLASQKLSKYDTAKYIFDYLHKNIFKSYLEKSTDIDQLIDTGYYNCVNSTAIYNILLKRFGYEPRIVQLPDHIFSVFYLDGYRVEVETTTKNGFDVIRNPEAIKELKQNTSYVYIPEGKGNRVELGENGLIASMYANQVLNYKDVSNYVEILKSSIKALMLERNLFLAYTNLRSAYIGIFVSEANLKNYQKAISIAEEAMIIFPSDREIEDFIATSYYNYVLNLVDSGEFSNALNLILFLKKEKVRYFGFVRDLIDYLIYKWGKSEIVKSNYDNVFRIIDVGYEIDRDKVYSAGVNLLVEISKVFLDRKDYEKVIIYNKWFVNKFPKGKEVYQNLGYYYNLWGIDLMNAGYLEKSVKVFEEGIKDLPNDNVLKQNCSIAYAKLSQMSFEKGDFENSVLFVNRAIELNSSKQLDELRKNIFIGWARYLAFSEENFNKAKEVCENGFRIYPNEIQLKKIYDYVMKKIKG